MEAEVIQEMKQLLESECTRNFLYRIAKVKYPNIHNIRKILWIIKERKGEEAYMAILQKLINVISAPLNADEF